MKIPVRRSCISLIVLSALVEVITSNENDTATVEGRQGRVNGRIVKLYSGPKPDPVLCTEEGFNADPIHCSIFYRCVKSSSGKFTVFKFQCGPGTIYDPETEVCNHPSGTKRSECGGIISPVVQDNDENEISQHELPSPIRTVLPIYTTHKMPITSSSGVYIRPIEDTTSSTPHPITTKRVENINYNLVAYPWTDYKNKTDQNSISSTIITPFSKKSEPCISDGFIGDNDDCRKFYRCVSNSRGGFIRYEFLCSDPTVWDDQMQGCNHPWAVPNRRCGGGRVDKENHASDLNLYGNNDILSEQTDTNDKFLEPSKQNSGEDNKVKDQPSIYGDRLDIVDESNVDKNHISYGSPLYQTTMLSNDKNKATKMEVTIKNLNNFDFEKSTIPTTNTTNKLAGKSFICTQSGLIGDSSDCKKFYRCVNNGKGSFTKYEFSCSQGTVWDKELEACNYAWAVKECGGSSIANILHTTESLTPTSSIATVINENIDNGYLNQLSQEHKPLTTVIVTTPISLISTTAALNTIDTICTISGFIGDKNDCKKFYRCVDNGKGTFTKYEYKCGDGTLWDQNIEACNHAWAVQSCNITSLNSTIFTTNANTSMTTPFMIQSTTNNNEYSASNEVYQDVTPFSTKIDLIKPTLPQMMTRNDCESTGFIGDNKDCKKFYRCVDNGQRGYIKYEFSCGEGTVWDPQIEACNHAWEVKQCGSSINSVNSEVTSGSTTNTFHTTNIYDSGIITTIPSIQTPSSQKEIDEYDSSYAIQQSVTTGKPAINFETTTLKQTLGQNVCQSSGFIGDIYNCNKFYRCVDNGNGSFIQHEFSCGEGTVWDSEIEACNHAWAVKHCGSNSSYDNILISSTANDNILITSTSNVNLVETNDGYVTHNYVDNGISTSSQIPSISVVNKNNECKATGFMGDKHDCKKFYRCIDSGNGSYIRYDFTCGEGTLWDPQIKACNHAWAVDDCRSSSTETVSNISTKPTFIVDNEDNNNGYVTNNRDPETTTSHRSTVMLTTFANSSNDCDSSGFIGDNKDCQKFYRCVDNGNGSYIKYEYLCGEGTVWDTKIKACNHKWAVEKCGGHSYVEFGETATQPLPVMSSLTESAVTTTHSLNYSSSTSSTPSDVKGCSSEGFFANLNDCKKFYRCAKEGNRYIKYEFSCVEGTIWVQEMQACDYDIDGSNCNITSGSTTFNSSNNAIEITTMKDIISVPNSTTGSYNTDIVDNSVCSSEGFYPNKFNCKHFYRCVNNGDGSFTKYDFTCGEGTAWDNYIQSCNYLNKVESCLLNQQPIIHEKPVHDEVETGSDTTKVTTPMTVIHSPKPTEQNVCHQEGYFGDAENCKKFYRCVYENNGRYTKYDFDCGDGTIWDQDIIACNHPYDVKNQSCKMVHDSTLNNNSTVISTITSSTSSETTLSTTTDNPSSTDSETSNNELNSNCSTDNSTKSPNNKNFTCLKAGFYADSSNCKKFYRCVDWDNNGEKFSIYHFECADGTIWDPALETCNHEESVYPPRNCTQQQNNNMTDISLTTEETTSTTNLAESSSSVKPTKSTQQTTTTSQYSSTQMETTQTSTTKKSTTQSSTTDSSTAQLSTTKEATTEISTTKESTTQSSTTQSSTIEEFTTEISTTKESTTQSSTMKEPTTDSSTVQELTTESSTTKESTTQSSTTKEPTTELLTTQELTTESSTNKESTTQSSTTNESQITTVEQSSEQSTTQITTQQVTTDSTTTQTNQDQTTKSSTTQTTLEETTTLESSAPTTQLTTTTDQPSITTEQATTEQSTNTQLSTVDTSSTTENNQEISTESNSSNQNCPDTDNDQSLFVCPSSFRRHPKYCNLFYQCTEDNESHEVKIAVFNCPNNTIYDESRIQCVEEAKSTKKCKGQIAQKQRVKRLGAIHNNLFTVTEESMACQSSGHFPFEKHTECSSSLLKCELTKSGKLRGFVYRCPEGFVYWNISRRCEAIRNVRDCKRSSYQWKRRYDIPLERFNIAN